MLSKKTKYALKALVNLARQPVDEPVLISELARQDEFDGKITVVILPDGAERYLSTALFEWI